MAANPATGASEAVTVRFVVDPSELEELGLAPHQVFGPQGGQPLPPPGAVAAGDGAAEVKGGDPGSGKGAGGLMTGAVVGVLTGGVLGAVQFLGQLVSNSKVLNTYAGAFGKVFSSALDLLMLPFVPVLNLMLAGLMKLVSWLITSGYLEKMSKFVQGTLVPMVEGIGAGLQHVWDAMGHSLDPRNWDWGKLATIVGASLEYQAAMLLSSIEQIPVIGDLLKGITGGDQTPLNMVNQARGFVGQGAVNQEQFNQLRTQWQTATVGGGVLGALPFGPGSALTGSLAGSSLQSMGGLFEQFSDAKSPAQFPGFGAPGAPAPLLGPGNTTQQTGIHIDGVSISIHGDDPSQTAATAKKQAQAAQSQAAYSGLTHR